MNQVIAHFVKVAKCVHVVLACLTEFINARVAAKGDRMDGPENILRWDGCICQIIFLAFFHLASERNAIADNSRNIGLTDLRIRRSVTEARINEAIDQGEGVAEEPLHSGRFSSSIGAWLPQNRRGLEKWHIGRHKVIIIKAEFIIKWVEVLLNKRLEVNEENGEPTIPEENLSLVFCLSGFFDLLVQLIESDDISEQVLKPSSKNVTKRVELVPLKQLPWIAFQACLEAVQWGWGQVEANPLCCVKDAIFGGCVLGYLFILPSHVRGVVDKDALFEIFGALCGTWQRFLGLESCKECIRVVKVHLCISVVIVYFIILA